MVWLALWCVSGAIVGTAVGYSRGRTGIGALLGTFCGVFGWLVMLGAAPKARAALAEVDSSVAFEDANPVPAVDLPPIHWTAVPPIHWRARANA